LFRHKSKFSLPKKLHAYTSHILFNSYYHHIDDTSCHVLIVHETYYYLYSTNLRISILNTVGDSPEGPKKPGESCLKPEKNKNKTHLLPKHAHRARPTLRWPSRPTGVAQSKAPSSSFRLARGLTPPSSRFRLARGLTPPSNGERAPPRSRANASLERAPPRSRAPHKRTGSHTRGTGI
jgi:hypothetical protein